MKVAKPEKIVVLGLMSRFPVAGAVWQDMHYLIGLQRPGCHANCVEARNIRIRSAPAADPEEGG